MKRISYLALLILVPFSLMAQLVDPNHHDHIAPLHSNPIVALAAKQATANPHNKRAQAIAIDTVQLPFLDDFSKPGPYPDTTWWIDKNVYVNFNMPVCPYSLGVATFDGLDSLGLPYHPNISPYKSDTADFLTSKPISWVKPHGGNYTLLDSVYLSFYYQAGSYFGVDGNGRSSLGYFPISTDTLMLQFKAAGQLDWHTVWSHQGYTPVADTDTVFHLVMIPFDSAMLPYMTSGFQFRFMNYSSCAAADHWNIDYVYLNAFRNYADTVHNDVAFVYDAPSMLANYTAEPWEQYQQTDLRTTPMNLFERNNKASTGGNPASPNIINETYGYTINTPGTTTTYSGGAYNLYPFVDSGYNKYTPQAAPPLTTTNFPSALSGPTNYTITHTLKNTGDFDPWNDTLRFNQIFNNYYAYDNSCPEYAYYINGIPNVPYYLAYQFSLNKADTIFGMDVYFDYAFVNAKACTMKMIVWNDKGGVPGDTVYVDDTIINPYYPNLGNDIFTRFKFRKAKPMPAGKFYIGFEVTTGDSINIGFEFNQNHMNQIFYCLDPFANNLTWYNSTFAGSLLMRPLVGSPKGPASVQELDDTANDVVVYPNPSKGVFNFKIANGQQLMAGSKIEVYNMLGENIATTNSLPLGGSGWALDLSTQPSGIYLYRITTKEGKLIKADKLVKE